jgi:ElaB/YqjD/DUF883 family membrane-anchored ribosome-binding protein
MANASTAESAGTDDLIKQINEIRADIAKLNKVIGNLGESSAADLKGQAKERMNRLSEATEDELRALRERADVAGRKLTESVREQPFAAVGIAAGVGFLIALLMRK